jgi:hypothetical protein
MLNIHSGSDDMRVELEVIRFGADFDRSHVSLVFIEKYSKLANLARLLRAVEQKVLFSKSIFSFHISSIYFVDQKISL